MIVKEEMLPFLHLDVGKMYMNRGKCISVTEMSHSMNLEEKNTLLLSSVLF